MVRKQFGMDMPDPKAAVVVLSDEERLPLEAWARRPRVHRA
jgi:hypothetical protein